MRVLASTILGVAVALFLGALAFRLWHYGYFGSSMMDDAFFFVRYAGNFLDTGVFEWNHGEGPVHGNTSQFYQVLVTAIHGLLDRNVVLSLAVASVLGTLAYMATTVLAYVRVRPHIDPTLRLLVCAVIVTLIAFDGQIFLLLGTGMETTWAMALVALSLLATFRIESGRHGFGDVLFAAVAIFLVYTVRPDAILLALAAPAGLVLFCKERRLRLAGLAAGALGSAFVGAFMLACWAYYGDALPLAFITKTTQISILPVDGRGETVGYPMFYLWLTILLHVPETILALLALAIFTRLSPALRGAALGMAVFTAYHLLFVVPIMGYFGRFHGPMLPILTLLAAYMVEAILAQSRLPKGVGNVTLAGAALLAGLGCLVIYKIVPTAARVTGTHLPALQADRSLNTKAGALAHMAQEFPFFRGRMVEMVDALGNNCSIASTEDGVLSAYARASRIVDISGLHDRWMARHGFSADRLLLEQKPDVLAMPHRWYGDWVSALNNHPALARDYIVEEAFIDTGEPMAFRRDSACALNVRQVLYGK